MKKTPGFFIYAYVLTLASLLLISSCVYSQVPQSIHYQSVLRDGTALMKNHPIDVRFSVLERTSGNVIFQEIHQDSTNDFGLVNLAIGEGLAQVGQMSLINWGTGAYDLKVEIDTGSGFRDMGSSPLVSVPFSLYADKSRMSDSMKLNHLLDVSAEVIAPGEVLKWNGLAWAPANDNVATGGGVVNTLPRLTGDGTSSNPLDLASQGATSGQVLKWDNANWTPGQDLVTDADADPGNELQSLSISGTDLSLSGGGGTISLPNGLWNANASNIYYSNGGVGIGTSNVDPEARLHITLPNSGNFARLLIESPANNVGFGVLFAQPSQDWYIGQNIGNWNDGRFQIAPDGSNHWLTMLPNGNVGLTRTGLTTPFARFQVPQNGDMDGASGLDVTQAAIFIGETQNAGIAIDRDQIESVANTLKINTLTNTDVVIASTSTSDGEVGIKVDAPKADFHVGEGMTILFGADTLGKSNFYPDPKMMFMPGRGGAFRVGQLNADGSIIGGTGWNFWNWSNIGWASVAIGNNTKASGAGSVALGIRAQSTNFGSVALGHLARTRGNSAVSAGYYTRADAFVGMAVGAGNVGGGSNNTWNALDPIFEVGNSIDTTNRSNAFTVLKNARVGINTPNPQSMLDIEQPNPGPGNGVFIHLPGTGHWETSVDQSADYNFYFNNALKSYILDTDGSYIKTSDRKLKYNIQPLQPVLSRVLQLKPSTYQYRDNAPGSALSTGFIAQDVVSLFPNQVVEKDGIKALKYDEFSVLAIQAIQEQQALIEEQKREIKELQKRLDVLEKAMKK